MKVLRVLAAAASLTVMSAVAQDFVSVAPRAKVLKENAKIRVIDFPARTGDKVPMHSHPMTVVYFLQGGAVRFTQEDGTGRELNPPAGEVLINPPVTHAHEHLADAHAILIEIVDDGLFAPPPTSTDLIAVASDHCRLLKENDKVRVYEYTARKGDKVPMHSHPAQVVYLIKSGKTQFTLADGTRPKPGISKDGEALINPPVNHAQEHLENVRAILVELKQ